MKIRPRRSVLYMPGANERALEKARTLPADSLILDLEDAVAPDAKPGARVKVCQAVKAGGYGRRELVIRVNGIETAWGMEDLHAAVAVEPDAILVPKVSQPGDIITVAKILKAVHAPEKIRLWAMMETPLAILNARDIAALGSDPEMRLACLVMGTNDLLKESWAWMRRGSAPARSTRPSLTSRSRPCTLSWRTTPSPGGGVSRASMSVPSAGSLGRARRGRSKASTSSVFATASSQSTGRPSTWAGSRVRSRMPNSAPR